MFSPIRVTRLLVIWLLLFGTAQAAAPQSKGQAPGYYRILLGHFVVTALSDGTVALPVDKLLLNTTPAQVDKTLARHDLRSPLTTSVNAFLINTGTRLVLIDTGAGSLAAPTLGKLVDNLKAAGFEPSQIDDIYITHMHRDHIGGLIAEGQRVFANATVHVSKRDADYWLSKANLDAAPKDRKATFEQPQAVFAPYIKAGKFRTFSGHARLMPGVEAIPAPGHTPGHTAYEISSDGQKLLVWGDIIHVAPVQFTNPEIAIKFDSAPKQAVKTRQKILKRVSRNGELIAGAHLAFPGLGHVRHALRGYTYLPANYQSTLEN